MIDELGKPWGLPQGRSLINNQFFKEKEYIPIQLYIPQNIKDYYSKSTLKDPSEMFLDHHMLSGNICFVIYCTKDGERRLLIINLKQMTNGIIEIDETFSNKKVPHWLDIKEIIDISNYNGPLSSFNGDSQLFDDMLKFVFYDEFEIK